MENLAGDLLFGLKLVKLSILPILFIQFVKGSLGEIKYCLTMIFLYVISDQEELKDSSGKSVKSKYSVRCFLIHCSHIVFQWNLKIQNTCTLFL